MNKIFYFFLLASLIIQKCYTATDSIALEQKIIADNTELVNFKGGGHYNREILKYKIYWEFIYAGDAVMGVTPVELYGKKLYRLFTETKSNKTIDMIYKVRNKTESLIDFYGYYTLKFFKDQNEAGYISKDNVIFDHRNNLWYDLLDNTTGYIPSLVHDVVSSLYWLRLQDIKVGEVYTFNVWVGRVVYPMIVDVIKIVKVKIQDKEYECYKIEPKVDLKTFPLFKAKGRLFVYITTDERKLPVRLESKVFIGRVFADLVGEE